MFQLFFEISLSPNLVMALGLEPSIMLVRIKRGRPHVLVVQLVGDKRFKISTVSVRIRPGIPINRGPMFADHKIYCPKCGVKIMDISLNIKKFKQPEWESRFCKNGHHCLVSLFPYRCHVMIVEDGS